MRNILVLLLCTLLCTYAIETIETPEYISDQPTPEQLIQSVPDVPSPPIQTAIDAITDEYHGQIRISISSGTQVAEMVEILDNESNHGRRLLQTSLSPEEKAALWFQQHGSIFGMAVGAFNGLQLVSNTIDNTTGHIHLMYEQYLNDIPVFGGRMNVHFDSTIQISAVNGNYVRDFAPVNTVPALSEDEVVVIAKRFLTKLKYDQLNSSASDTFAQRMASLELYTNSTLMIFRYGILQNVPGSSVLTFKIILHSTRIRHIIYVNAHTGDIVEDYQDKHEVLMREVQRYEKATKQYSTVWTEGQGPTGNAAYDGLARVAKETYNFIGSLTKGGYLSFNGHDGRMLSVLDTESGLMACPNAMFDGSKSVFCQGTTADDVVAHEWGHGYTGSTSGLVYKYQQGAMNEAFSDIWGETIDALNNFGTDSPSIQRTSTSCVDWRTNVKWMIGEDATSFGGPIRDMWQPECRSHPGKVTSTMYRCGTTDNGGVHSNSGVVNRFYSLLVDGGTYNGQTVSGIGFAKAAHLMWQVGRYYLTSVSGFPALASSLPSACRDLLNTPLPNIVLTDAPWTNAGTGPALTTADCTQVDKAATATELRLQPNCNFGYVINAAPYPLCPVSSNINYDLLFENFENRDFATNGWTTTSVGVASEWNRRTWTINAQSDGREGYGAFATNLGGGNCGSNDQSGVMRLISKPMTVSHGAGGIRVAFEHYYATEDLFDGGNVQIEVNGGAPTVIPKASFLYNGYPYTLATTTPGYNTNPMRGQPSFTGAASTSGPQGIWVRSVIDLSSTVRVGDTFKLSFQFGSDGCSGVVGWYVDDIRVYYCGTDYCALSPCFNGGTCTNNVATQSRTCSCRQGFSGPDCSTIDSQSRTYSWLTADFSSCSHTCDGGVSTRAVTCIDDLNTVVTDSFCITYAPSILKPATQQSCNTQACPPTWRYSLYSSCSVTCGSGVETRTAACVTTAGVVVADSLCTGTQESLSRPCTQPACATYAWRYTDFSACSRTCGGGTRTRTATCVNQLTQAVTTADLCTGQPLPTSESCNTRACATWSYSAWSTCSVGCGGGTQTRTAECRNADNSIQANTAECGTRDILSRTCNEAACITYAWRYSGWSECSAPCNGGTHTRTASCIGSDGSTATNTALCGTQGVLSGPCNTLACRTYQWVYGEWSDCDEECGTGFQTRSASCRDDTGATAFNSQCTSGLEPTTQRCNTQPCVTYRYTYGAWTTCPVQCGGGTQTRSVTCTNQDDQNVAISFCTGTPEASSQPCNTSPCVTYTWNYGNWGPCTATCGGGTETRTATCMASSGAPASGPLCGTSEPTVRSCATSPCVTYSWNYSGWSTCSVQCGAGTQSRTATCRNSAGAIVADTLCTAPKASLTGSCTGTNCPVAVSWYNTPWTTCDVLCGGGTSRRYSFCVTSTFNVVPDAQCQATTPKPDTTQPCNTQACTGVNYRWYTFAWGRCSANCNGGTSSRSVVCVDATYRIYSNSFCDAATKPTNTQPCNTSPCSKRWRAQPWSACSAECGSGSMTREVECIDDTTSTTLTESECSGVGEKPSETETCNTNACPAWSEETFGTCSLNCGGGTQTRAAARCLDYTGAQVDASQCTTSAPATTQSCNSQACATFDWRVLEWQQCPVTCGGGTQWRTVRCIKSTGQMWPDLFCRLGSPKPDQFRPCNTEACGGYTGQFWTSGWYSCVNGVQTRDVLCIDSSYYQVDDSRCNPAARPATARAC